MRIPSITYVFMYVMVLGFIGLLAGCGNLPKSDVLFISTAGACEEIGYGLSGASKFKARFSEVDKGQVEGIITDSQKVCKDRDNPPSTTQIASDSLQILMRRIQSLVARYAASS